MDIKTLKVKVEQFLGDNSREVLESEGQKLHALPNIVSRKFVLEFSGAITSMLYHDQAVNDETFQLIQKVLIHAQIIKSRYDKAEIALKKAINHVKNNPLDLVLDSELEEGAKIILNDQVLANELIVGSEEIYQALIKTYCTNASINSGLFKAGMEIALADIEKTHPRIAQHAKKTAFDQMCLLVFGHHPEQYDILRKVEEIDSNHKMNQLMEVKVKKNQILFSYLEMEAMTVPKFPRYAALLSHHEGVGCPVEEVIHQTKELPIQCIIAGQEVVVKVPAWYGFIITKVDSSVSKPLDLDEILNQAQDMVKEDPELASIITKVKEDQLLEKTFLNTFEKLATSTNQNYSQILSQLKKQAQGVLHASR